MHRPKTERQALAQRLLGTPEVPGPIDVGWVKRRYGVQGSHIKRWREEGIPAARVDDLEAAILELTTKDAPPDEPAWASEMSADIVERLELNRGLIETLLPPERRAEADALIADFEESLRQRRGVVPPLRTGRSSRDAGSPQAQADGSPRVPNGEE